MRTSVAPAALILDLDGVVTDTAAQHEAAWRTALESRGLPFRRDAYEGTRGLSREDSLRAILGDTEIDAALFSAIIADKNTRYVAGLGDLRLRDVLPGILDLLLAAEARHWKVAVGSSSRNAAMVLDTIGISDLFDAVADGAAGDPKPAPDIFLAAASMLGVEPTACIVIEDAASGVDAARAAGMRVIGVGPAERVGHADVRVDATRDLDLDVLEPLLLATSPGGPAA